MNAEPTALPVPAAGMSAAMLRGFLSYQQVSAAAEGWAGLTAPVLGVALVDGEVYSPDSRRWGMRLFGTPPAEVIVSAALDACTDPADVRIRAGQRFVHRSFREAVGGVKIADSPYVIMRVTSVKRTGAVPMVYYRRATDTGRGHRFHSELRLFPQKVRGLLPDQRAALGWRSDLIVVPTEPQ